jgi:hypothetical protein
MATNLNDPRYEAQVKYRCISRTINVTGAVMYGKAREYGRRMFPDFSNDEHNRIVSEMDRMIPRLERAYRREAEIAALETWNRSLCVTDYRVSAIYSDEFSTERKNRLRTLCRKIERAKDVRLMHLAARRRASKYHPAP